MLKVIHFFKPTPEEPHRQHIVIRFSGQSSNVRGLKKGITLKMWTLSCFVQLKSVLFNLLYGFDFFFF